MRSSSPQSFRRVRKGRSSSGSSSIIAVSLFALLAFSASFFVCIRYLYNSKGSDLLQEEGLPLNVLGRPFLAAPTAQHPEKENRDGPKADHVRDMMRHAWTGYETYAWGMDELNPVSCQGKLGVMGGNNGFSGLGASMVDAMSTLHLMEMEEEFARAKDWVREKMDPSKGGDQDISFFETVIRLLGGLVSAYDLSGDKALLDIAEDLGDRLVGVFDGERSGIATNRAQLPLTRPDSRGSEQVLIAEAFSNLVELGALGLRTGREDFQLKAEAGVRFLHARNARYLVGESVTRSTGKSHGRSTVGAPADSYYEYLLKYWILGGKTDDHWRERWVNSVDEALRDLKLEAGEYKLVGDRQGKDTLPRVSHLGCFFPGNVALGVISGAVQGDKAEEYLDFAEGMMMTCERLYSSTATGLGADSAVMNMDTGELHLQSNFYFQRPEVVESLFYLWRATHDVRWREMAWSIIQAIDEHCRVECGYSGVRDATAVSPNQVKHDDVQQSWFLAETLKYLFLIFEDDSKIDIADGWVFNTEAHPVKAVSSFAPTIDWSYLERSIVPWLSWTLPHVRRVVSLFSQSG